MDTNVPCTSRQDESKTVPSNGVSSHAHLQLPITGYSKKDSLIKLDLCGFSGCRPLWMQRFATPKWFLTAIGLFVLVQSMLVSGITSSVITTIEKRYGLRSAESGLIVSAFDIGSLVVVVFISYFGGQGHRARWVGVGAVTVAVGAALFSLPHFLSLPYNPPELVSSASTEILCVANRTNNTDLQCDAEEANTLYLLLFIVSNMIMGIGSTPIYTLGSTYLYDNVPRDDASLYISMLYAIGAVGPAAGYLLGGFFLSFYVDLGNTLSSGDPRFLGAWWFGYLVCAGFIFLFSVFLLMFPPKLQIPESKTTSPGNGTPMSPISISTVATETTLTIDSFDNSVINFGKNLKELPMAFFSLLTNSVYMCVTFSATLEFSIVTAFMTFVPKYLQSHFNSDTVTSSIITGAILVPSAGTGILLGGYIIKRLKLDVTGCAKTAFVSSTTALLLFLSVFFISCETSGLVGISSFHADPLTGNAMTGLNSVCNAGCSCDDSTYQPVCSGSVNYYNPCYAGCLLNQNDNLNQTTFANCSCILADPMNLHQKATLGECERDCSSALIPFLVCLFLVTMATVCAHTPSLMVTYRCVKGNERPFAAGIQFLFFRTLAYIPAPIYFGTAIDQACLLWYGATNRCDNNSGSCRVYNADTFRYIFFGVAFSLKIAACFFVFLAWILCRRKYIQQTDSLRWRKIGKKKQFYEIKKSNCDKNQDKRSSICTMSSVTAINQPGNISSNNTTQSFEAISLPSQPPATSSLTIESSGSSVASSESQTVFLGADRNSFSK